MALCGPRLLGTSRRSFDASEGRKTLNLSAVYTLVVPTYNRPGLLRGLLSALREQGVSCTVLVLDSSTPENKKLNSQYATDSGVQATYIEYPEAITPQRKMALALSQVRTKYVSFCADDDVIFLDSVGVCIDELERDSACVGCHGVYLNFSPARDKTRIYVEYCAPSIVGADYLARLFRLLARYESIFYATFRTEHLKKVLSVAKEVDKAMFYEIFAASAVLVFGGVRRIDSLYYARRGGLVATHTDGEPWHWMRSKTDALFREFIEFRSRLLAFVEQNGEPSGSAPKTDEKILAALYLMFFQAAMPSLEYQKQEIGRELSSAVPAAGNPFRSSKMVSLAVAKIDAWHHKMRDWLMGEYIISKSVGGVSFEMQERVNRLVPGITTQRLAKYCREIETTY